MATGKWRTLLKVLQRKKLIQPDQLEISPLKRCLNRWDLTGLGLGSTLGVGVYVLVGSVALRWAGPSIVLSFVIAAVAALLAGLCYAEFSARVPRAGSAYVYTYVAIGEFAAFIVGWNMILEGLFGTASIARGLSSHVDSMTNGSISTWFTSVTPLATADGVFSAYFDFLAFFIVLMMGVLLSVGVRASSMVNNVLAALNMLIILFIIIVGAFKADTSNWSISELSVTEVSANIGAGGFFPFGVWGTLRGAALCFYGFVGFDAITATAEEVSEPRKFIPQTILIVLSIALIVNVSVSTVVTMMVPYYLLDKVAAVATAFTYVGWNWAQWVVSVGAVFGICASTYGALFPLPRLLYSMAGDGLLQRWLQRVHSTTQTPLLATILPACLIAILAAVVQLEQLILMVCIGTLFSYTVVAAGVIILRYHSKAYKEIKPSLIKQIVGFGERKPTKTTSRITTVALLMFMAVCVISAAIGIHVENSMIAVLVLHVSALLLLVVIMLQPQTKEELLFKTPLVPIVPCISIHINIHLMILVSWQTWIRVIIWILIGIPIYAICLCCNKQNESEVYQNEHIIKNGKPPIQIVVESPTPPNSLSKSHNRNNSTSIADINADEQLPNNEDVIQIADKINHAVLAQRVDEILIEEAIIENNEEKEAKIIDLLDQVLQAEEDSYVEQISLNDMKSEDEGIMVPLNDPIPHRKSLSELSDAGSDASLGNQGLSKYSVIAQVHREDLSKLNEVEEQVRYDDDEENVENEPPEDITEVENSETNSRTDESGYSDTLDRNALNDSMEDTREDVPYIPTPPPLDLDLYNSLFLMKKSFTVPISKIREKQEQEEVEEENKPRESVQSNNSTDDGSMVFGSSKQMKFMNKLNNIFQTKIASDPGDQQERKRSNSTGTMIQNPELKEALMRERPSLYLDMKKELLAIHPVPNLKPVNADTKESKENKEETKVKDTEPEEETEQSFSREDLKARLAAIYAGGGPSPMKPRKMKSNPPTPEEAYQTETSSTESIVKLPKMEKNDTLKRQKDKFSEVLNSFRLSLNKEDAV